MALRSRQGTGWQADPWSARPTPRPARRVADEVLMCEAMPPPRRPDAPPKRVRAVSSAWAPGSVWDPRRCRWVTPQEDFAKMARQARTREGEPMTAAQLLEAFLEVARRPDDPKQDKGARAFARRILTGLGVSW